MKPATPEAVTVLLVDDDGARARLIQRVIEAGMPGGRLVLASDADEAWRFLFPEDPGSETAPEVILVQRHLARASPGDLISAVRDAPRLARKRVVLLSSFPDEGGAGRGSELEPDLQIDLPQDVSLAERSLDLLSHFRLSLGRT